MKTTDLNSALAANLGALAGSAEARAIRESALADFERLGFPSRKLESWRYTNVSAISEGSFELFPPPEPVDEAEIDHLLAAAGLAADAASLVFADGELVADRAGSWRSSSAVALLSLADRLNQYTAPLPAKELENRSLAALNAAFACGGMQLRLAAGADPGTPLHILLANVAGDPRAVHPQIIIEIEELARAKVFLHLLDRTANGSWTNALTVVRVGAGATLELNRVQHYHEDALHTELLHATLAKDSQLRMTSLDVGGRLVRNDVCVRLEAPGAECDLAGISVAAGGQHIDNHIAVAHNASETRSVQSYRAIVGDRGRCIFNGKVAVKEGTRGISAIQSSDNLLLAETGEIDTKPELEINADDVRCSHGATVGELDESQLFYLRSRGIAEAVARGLLTLAFAERILERIPSFGLRGSIAEKFGLALPADATWKPEA